MWQMLSMLYVCVRTNYTTQLSLSFSIKSACYFYSRVRPTKSTSDGDPMTLTHLALLLAAAGILALGGAPLVALIAAATVAYLTGSDE